MKHLIAPFVAVAILNASLTAWAQMAPPPPPVPTAGSGPAIPPPPPAPPGNPGDTPYGPSAYDPSAGLAVPAVPVVPAAPAPIIYQPAAPYAAPEYGGVGLLPGNPPPRWDVSIDALWLERTAGQAVFLGGTNYNPDSGIHPATPIANLWSDDAIFPLEPGIRLQVIGRMSDRMAIEATGWGLQNWSVGRTLVGDSAYESVLGNSPWLVTSEPPIGGYDKSLSYTYASDAANAEINQRFKLNVLDPFHSFNWLWGVRYFALHDNFALAGTDHYTGTYESAHWTTKNNLIGMQVGLQWVGGWDRFQMSTEAKVGLLANAYSQDGSDSYTGVEWSHSGTNLSALVELSILARYRIARTLWLRGGYQYYGVTGLALGPQQLPGFEDNGYVGFDGLSCGLEFTH
jgi:hypothetical protein